MSGQQLDLDAIEARAKEAVDYDGYEGGRRAAEVAREDVPALVARVRELEAELTGVYVHVGEDAQRRMCERP